MTIDLSPAHTAVLSMDLQAGIVSAYAQNHPDLIQRAAHVLDAARTSGMIVIHVQVGFRPGFPEVNPRNPLFGAILRSPERRQLFRGSASGIHPALGPAQTDIVITKHRISAFAGTDLEMILRARQIDTLILFGIATSGVVLSTLLDACDADYRIIVASDCCLDAEPELHACLMDRLFPRRGTVLTAAELLPSFGYSSPSA